MNTLSSQKLQLSPTQWRILNMILVISMASLFYKYLEFNSLKHTSALFIGIPTFMGIVLALTPRVKHVTRNILIGTALGLVSSLVVLKEGSFCVPMTAPLFLGVAAIIGLSYERAQKNRAGKIQLLLVILALGMLSLEGVVKPLTLPRAVNVSAEQIINASVEDIEAGLASMNGFKNLPLVLKAGFPQPVWVKSEGLNIGDRRSVHFSGGEGEPGTAVFEITARGTNWVRFELIEDTSHISHWLKWKTSEVHWQSVEKHQTRVEWKLSYDRQLDPSWYFGPMEKYAAKLAAQALINNILDS